MDPGEAYLFFRAVPAHLRPSPQEQRDLREFAGKLSESVAAGRPFACLITNDKELRKLNYQFLGNDYPTDVLSFPSTGGDGLGDLAISAERAEAQAEHFGHSRLDEYRLLMLHGLLHLTGFDHERDRGEMTRAEHKWRAQFVLPDTLISRSSAKTKKR